MTNTMQGIGFKISKFRETKGLTQEALGNKVGLTQPAICQIEKGKRAHLNFQHLENIALALEIDVWDLFQVPVTESRNSDQGASLFFSSKSLRNALTSLSSLSPNQQDKVGQILQSILELP